MFWRTLIGIAIALVVTWAVLVVYLVRARPKGSLLQEALRLLPDTLRLLRRLATDRAVPSSMTVARWDLEGSLARISNVLDLLRSAGAAWAATGRPSR